jgi:regulator of sirC expression with transglutaminase-like and TPR domain
VVIEVEDAGLAPGRAGLVKFRQPEAEFRRFRMGRELPPEEVPEETARRALALASDLAGGGAERAKALDALGSLGGDGIRALRDRAAEREREAQSLRLLADSLYSRAIAGKLREALAAGEEEIDLLEAALLLARLDNPDLEPEAYRRVLDRLAADVRAAQAGDATGEEKLKTLIRVFFGDWGFHGSGLEYYHRSNSYLNEVLDDREGIPITLSVIFLELARRIGLPARGVGTPGHFLVEWKPPEGPSDGPSDVSARLIDVFNGGKMVSRAEVELLTGRPLDERDFAPAKKREIIVRMLHNLLGVAEREEDQEGMLRYLDVILTLEPDSGPDRRARAALRFRAGRLEGAAEDLDWFTEHPVPGVNPAEIEELREFLRARRE